MKRQGQAWLSSEIQCGSNRKVCLKWRYQWVFNLHVSWIISFLRLPILVVGDRAIMGFPRVQWHWFLKTSKIFVSEPLLKHLPIQYSLKLFHMYFQRFPQERAVKKNTCVKYLVGGLLLFIIIIIVWFPLLFFSFLHTVYISNPPIEASMTIAVGGYPPLFTATATTESIRPLTEGEFNLLKVHFSRDRVSCIINSIKTALKHHHHRHHSP